MYALIPLAFLMTSAGYGTGVSTKSESDPRCTQVAPLNLPGVQILAVESLAAGTFAPNPQGPAIENLPAFCRVVAVIRPVPESNIRIELWLPRHGWNGRLLGTGNGGAAGGIIYRFLGFGLKRGFATVNTDLGTSPGPESAIGQPTSWIDFGQRATHEMTVTAKAIIAAFYGKPAQYTYFVGGSTGGQQALVEAQRFPEDYDGIFAGAPANNRTHLHVGFLWNWRALTETSASSLSAEQLDLVTRAVIAANAGKDGGAPGDNFLTDPRLCEFNFEVLLAPDNGPGDNNHLSAAQVVALRKIYAGPTNPRTGERIYTPPPLGSERGLSYQQNASKKPEPAFPWIIQWAFGADYEFGKFDFDHDLDALDAELAPFLNANNPDLTALHRRGGKILMYTGTADNICPFQDAINYYERVLKAQGGLDKTQEFFRFFIIPGMAHGGGGPGLNDIGHYLTLDVPQDSEHDGLHVLMRWVEEGIAPDRIIATAYKEGKPANGIRFRRPIFPYPKFPHYTGGDVNSPRSYEGVAHPRGSVLTPSERYLK